MSSLNCCGSDKFRNICKRVCFDNIYSSLFVGSIVFLTLLTALLVITKGTKEEKGIIVNKCCGIDEMIGSDGQSCVVADWGYSANDTTLGDDWVHRWLPPELPPHRVDSFSISLIDYRLDGLRMEVNASTVWNDHNPLQEDVWRTHVVFLQEAYIVRPRPGGRKRDADYCVDAAMPPLGPHVLLFKTLCIDEDCVEKCCSEGEVMVKTEGKWKCEVDEKGYWWPFNSSLAKYIDREIPHQILNINNSEEIYQLVEDEDPFALWAGSAFRHFFFSGWMTCFDYYRNESVLEEGLFYSEQPRIARGIYWMLRPLCVVTTLLLAATLLSIACNRGLRQKEFGCCLASHALCLFGFNLGQVVYYVAMSDSIDAMPKRIPSDLQDSCTHLALWMYFFLMAGWSWLTILCVIIASGFKIEAAAPKRSGRKKILVYSVIAWGIPALMTIICCFLFTPPVDLFTPRDTPWYHPSLVETRVCYNEDFRYLNFEDYSVASLKDGTAVFYYDLVGCLAICNLASLVISLRKVRRLRRGTSILRREEELRMRQKEEGNDSSTAEEPSCGAAFGGCRGRTVDAKAIKLYIKLVMMTGALELTSEIIIWATSHYAREYAFQYLDYHYPYRSAGYVTDFIRAVCVAWLAAPEGGYLGPLLSRLRGEKK